jgi:cell division protein FtsI (penicillin-binding protein 3)
MSRAMPAPSIGLQLRGLFVAVVVGALFLGVAAQLVRLSLVARNEMRVASAEPIGRVFARPDILDRGGRLVATDVAVPSLYADPAMILDLDEVVEKLARTFPDLDAVELRKSLGDRTRRFAWIKRGLAPLQAQRAHDLGLPGLAFRREPKRVYPAGQLLGHLVG